MTSRTMLLVGLLGLAACTPHPGPYALGVPEPAPLGQRTGSYVRPLAPETDRFDQGVLDPDIHPD